MFLSRNISSSLRTASVGGITLVFPRSDQLERYAELLNADTTRIPERHRALSAKLIKRKIQEVASTNCRLAIPDEHIDSFVQVAHMVHALYDKAVVTPHPYPIANMYYDAPFCSVNGTFDVATRLLEIDASLDNTTEGRRRTGTIAHEIAHGIAPSRLFISGESNLTHYRHGGSYSRNGSKIFATVEELSSVCTERAIMMTKRISTELYGKDFFIKITLKDFPEKIQRRLIECSLSSRERIVHAWRCKQLLKELHSLRNATHTLHCVPITTERMLLPQRTAHDDSDLGYIGIRILIGMLEKALGIEGKDKEWQLATNIINMIHGPSPRRFLSLMKELFGPHTLSFLASVNPTKLEYFALFFSPEKFGITHLEEIDLLRKTLARHVHRGTCAAHTMEIRQ